ncbi:hypothetical protein CHS0354_029280 [Potamilus streckersoni]|uniref:Uncharacterized protein n=1 Tax=Potamilus streckersoni TaxID=2493646 RepID=A0AAE0T0B5_9BIVA|nr:hypothetical protein CHS0354_029280 [Potamilus streckersoni]
MAEMEKKKTFEFRMSKKVAELTQVVHMLFTRNHEKEVEIEAVKEAYEHEISLILEDAKRKIFLLENKVSELERKLEREQLSHTERVQSAVKIETSNREEEWRKKLLASEKNLQEEKMECQNLRDMLISAQKDIEKLRKGMEEQLSAKGDELYRKDKDIEKLKKQNSEFERLLRDNERQSNETIRNLERDNERLAQEFEEMQELLEETHKIKEHLLARNKQLESDFKNLKRDFNKKVSEVVNSQQQMNHTKTPRSAPSTAQKFTDYNDELEKLRREVQRYRLELSNRDNNFNRMFTDHQPLIVDSKAGKIGMSQTQVMTSSSPMSAFSIPASPNAREKTFSYAVLQSFDESPKRSISRLSSASGGKLPVLTPEQKTRLTKLMKPRPLPKEMLFSK